MTDFAEMLQPVAQRLLGDPNRALSTAREMRFGNHGSLSIEIAGERKGVWHDHETGQGGGTLDLITRQRGGDRRSALEWLKAEFGDVAAPTPKGVIVAEYTYEDALGRPLFQVVRLDPKDFRQRRADGRGGFEWGMKGVNLVPYRLPEMMEAIGQDRLVFIAEGEKAVEALRQHNLPATCSPGGAGKWRDSYAAHFKGAQVAILPDNDEPGEAHAQKVAAALVEVAAVVKVVKLPDLPRKGDVFDWLAAGGESEKLYELVERTPLWRKAEKHRLPRIWFGHEDEAPALSWLIKGALTTGGLSALIGPPGGSKSFLALDLSLHVAHGLEWFGRPVKAGVVAYVSGEGGAGMLTRMKAWRASRACARGPFALIPASVNLFDGDDGVTVLVDELHDIAQQARAELRLVVLDTLSRMIGSGDEDRARDLNTVINRAEKIQRETGAHVMIVHHTGKEESRGARGSNNIIGGSDTVMQVWPHGEGLFELKFVKVKDGETPKPLTYTLAQSVLGKDADGETISSCVIEPSDASPGAKGKASLSNPQRIAMDALSRALDEHGQDRPSLREIPSCVARVVEIAHWRATAYDLGITDEDSAEARKKAFQRVREALQAKGRIGIWKDLAWIA